jgi:hypothetical protein
LTVIIPYYTRRVRIVPLNSRWWPVSSIIRNYWDDPNVIKTVMRVVVGHMVLSTQRRVFSYNTMERTYPSINRRIRGPVLVLIPLLPHLFIIGIIGIRITETVKRK